MQGFLRFMLTGKVRGTLPVPEAENTALEAAREGIVLLRNDGILPLAPCECALFGVGAEKTAICGTGSGFVYCPGPVSVRDGLEAGGFSVCTQKYLNRVRKLRGEIPNKSHPFWQRRFNGEERRIEEPVIEAQDMEGCDTCRVAVYVITRNAGEETDRRNVPGDFMLSEAERKNLERLRARFEKLIIVLNTPVIDASPICRMQGIAVLLLGQAGMGAGTALCDILTGRVCPSGHLCDTWARGYADYPASRSFGMNDGQTDVETYEEDLFVGYRHFDARQLPVLFPFGFGLSYTRFERRLERIWGDWQKIRLEVSVRNTGKTSGKDVVQLYIEGPETDRARPIRMLCAFAKTDLLEPGEEQKLCLTLSARELSYFDEEKSAFMVAPGTYSLLLGEHSRSLVPCGEVEVDRECMLMRVSRALAPETDIPWPPRPQRQERPGAALPRLQLRAQECPYEDVSVPPEPENWRGCEPLASEAHPVSFPRAVQEGKMEAFAASLDLGTLLRLVTGDACQTEHAVSSRLQEGMGKAQFHKMAAGKTTNLFFHSLGIPAMSLSDGPAGLHLIGSPAAAYPVGMVLAQTWNTDLLYRVGDSYGREMEKYHVTIALAPGMNLHRDPLCGRNFEYYSEDPLLSGKLSAAFTRGLQENHPGRGVAVKHFACNNQETNRLDMEARVSVRALRELYLRSFELCVKEAAPMTLMTAYNRLNGTYCSESYDLLTRILRGEWGFDGLVMSDWDTHSSKGADYRAGTDLVMGGYPAEAISACVKGLGPRFDRDGSVHMDMIPFYGGILRRPVEAWGSFIPDRNGPDRLRVPVEERPGLRARGAELLGLCEIEREDGKTVVIYKGHEQGAQVSMGQLQRAALRVLRILSGVPLRLASGEERK